jgi:hypothetical protein
MILVAMGVGIAVAAPYVPRLRVVSDEERSLARIEQVALVISPLPKEVTRAGLSKEKLHDQIKTKLVEIGYQVTADARTTPRLVVTVLVEADTASPDLLALIMFMDVQQKVRVHRLDSDLVVPTATISELALVGKSNMAQIVKDAADAVVTNFKEYEENGSKQL